MVLRVGLVVTILASAPAAMGHAQGPFAAAGAGLVLTGGEGLTADCRERSTQFGAVLRAGYDFAASAGFEASAAFHSWEQGSFCIIDGSPPDGTFLSRDRRNLFTHPFVALDVRFRFRTARPPLAPLFSLGAGATLRSGVNLPYAVLGAAVAATTGPIRVVLQSEFYLIRVHFDLVERTWSNGVLVSVIPRGVEHRWKPAAALRLVLEAPLRL